jgi:hypothetical protein
MAEHADCIDFMRGGSARVDAREIQTAIAHQDSVRAAAEVPFVNLADPARALGPDGRPAVSRRAPIWEDVPEAQWNDWRWQLSHRVNDLHEIERVLNLTDEEREGLSAPDKFRVDITPYFISLIDPNDPDDAIRRQVIPLGREQQAFTAMMEDSLAEDRHSPVPGLVHRYPDRVLMLVTTQCASYCRYCTRSRIVGDATHPARPPRDPAHRDHPDRVTGAGLPAAADRRRVVRDAREVPPALDQPPLQPPQRDHARSQSGGRQAGAGRSAHREPERAARRRQ